MVEFIGNIILKGQLECITGMHIGGSKEKFEIGGVDSPVIRDPVTNFPYIPGSSLKGKLRSLLTFELGFEVEANKKLKENDAIYYIFGESADDKKKFKGPTRLIVRDAYPSKKTIQMWENLDSELLYTEFKAENTIDRLTSTANPRFLERVVKGSIFNVEFVYGIYEIESKNDDSTSDVLDSLKYFPYFITALRLLENSYLGGSGTRGYGKVAFKFVDPIILFKEDYEKGTDKFVEVLKDLDSLYPEGFKHKRLSDFDDDFIKTNIIGVIENYIASKK
ncbi:MAG: type III-A CRISPR-associated RAMP protein Csm3 [Candidatus Kapaibacteriota bacterium]|jgi:CRISPR-associated protein Csm3